MGRKKTENPLGAGAHDIPEVWTFESEIVAHKFDDHVREQLSWYDPLSQFVADIAISFLPTDGTIYDIGASTGNMTLRMMDEIMSKGADAISIEPSHAMAGRWRGVGELHRFPAEDFDFQRRPPDVAIMFLSLMFMRTETREKFLSRLFDSLKPGGCVIIVDKGYLKLPETQIACKAATVADKQRSGTPADSYMMKELSLRGEQRPTNMQSIQRVASDNGLFSEEFFRFGEFYGIICFKRSV
jgi:tRNA (cmo5U34)-methyltransferase